MDKVYIKAYQQSSKIEFARTTIGQERCERVFMSADMLEVSDGYHTFDELYDHRITLYIALCEQIGQQPYDDEKKFGVWRSKLHSDGSSFDGWFVLGIGKETGKQITYHLPLERWEETEFAETLEKGPEFDGHTPAQVLERLKTL